ncbi:MAG: CDP-archaeol synthase [bacterium]|nr:CDP-archaeol synthase [bacterium]
MPDSIQFLAICFYFIFPAYAANIAPILAKRFNILSRLDLPIDCNARWNGKPVLGPHKTLRGFVLGTTVAIAVVLSQTLLYPFFPFPTLGLVNYAQINPFLLGFLLGFGSLLGDSLGSLIKRRIGRAPGESLFGLDQTGMAIVAIASVVWIYPLSLTTSIALIAMTFLWHITAARTAFLLKIRREKW